MSSSKALRASHTREEPQECAWCSQPIKTGFLKIAALRGSDFDPLAPRPFLSPLHHPCRAANLIIPLHRHTQAPNIIHLAPSNFSSPQITAQAPLLWLSLPRRYRGARGVTFETHGPIQRHEAKLHPRNFHGVFWSKANYGDQMGTCTRLDFSRLETNPDTYGTRPISTFMIFLIKN